MESARTDAQLVEAARSGDKAAFTQLVVRHYPLLLALCRRALWNLGSAEDAAQEAILQAMLGLDRLNQADRFGAWLMAIGLNMCNRLKRQRAHTCWSSEAVFGGKTVGDFVETRTGPEEMAEVAELRAQVQSAVAALPPGQRAAVLHFYLAGLSHAETASLLGIGVGAVKTRLHKARRSLRRQLWITKEEMEMDDKLSRRTLTKAAGALAGAAAVGRLQSEAAAEETLIEMQVRDVRNYGSAGDGKVSHVCLLEGVDDRRILPIWMGEFEATALAVQIEGVATPRPLAYAFAAGLLQAVGGTVREVRINRLEDTVFYAETVVEGPEGVLTVDARPSDALNLALLTGAPIRVDPAVVEAAEQTRGRKWDSESGGNAADLAGQFMSGWSAPDPED